MHPATGDLFWQCGRRLARRPTMKINPHIWADGRTARKIDHRCTQIQLLICVHLWSKKSCFVGHERLCGGAEPPFSSIAVLAQPLANSVGNLPHIRHPICKSNISCASFA
jgi:hypothetical protein